MKLSFLRKSFYVILFIDILIIIASFFCAHLLRFDFKITEEALSMFLKALPIVLIIKLICFTFFDLYRGMWRYASLYDLFNIIKASILSFLLIIFVLLLQTRFLGFSRSVFIIDLCLSMLFIAGFRISVRFYFECFTNNTDNNVKKNFKNFFKFLFSGNNNKKRLLIIGAGDCGEKIFRELRDNARLEYNIIGFLDDNPVKIGKKIHGIPVMGAISQIKDIVAVTRTDIAIIAIPSAASKQMRHIINLCNKSGIEFKTIPGMGELINGKVSVKSIRDVAYRDILGRDIIKLDEKKIGCYLNSQTVLVTGAAGSIGSELCRQICRFSPKAIVLCEIAESPLYEIDLELKNNFKHIKILPVLTDICDKNELEKVFQQHKPQIIFHAAAYKHVPMLELQPWNAIKNNIQGTLNMVQTAKSSGVEKFVFVSTDKAVRPANIMGASKRVAEMIVQCQNGHNRTKTKFVTVRFGNVIGSAGSVIPLFKKQIANGGPVTVTHPEINRYFMTIPEACQLILQAGSMSIGSEIFLFEMGSPVKISDMAKDLIRFSGLKPDEDIKIKYIGLRPGEKLYEELITEGEGIVQTGHDKIMMLKGSQCDIDLLNTEISELIKLTSAHDKDKIKAKLKEIVPEYCPAS